MSEYLIAVHNLSLDKLNKTMELDAIPAPSIAVTKSDIGHTNYGDISLVLGHDSIAPSRNNHLYDCDIWSPTFPTVEFEIDSKKASELYSMYRDNQANIPKSMDRTLSTLFYDANIESSLNSEGSIVNFENKMRNMPEVKALFLATQGISTSDVMSEQPAVSDETMANIQQINEMIPEDKLNAWYENKQHGTGISAIPDDIKIPLCQILDIDASKPLVGLKGMRANGALEDAYEYNHGTLKLTKTVLDTAKTLENIDYLMTNDLEKEYDAWCKNDFGNISTNKGIRNNLSYLTSAGNRRTFKQLHMPLTAENVVKLMQSEGLTNVKGESPFSVADMRVLSAIEYTSLDGMKDDAIDRIQYMGEEELQARETRLQDRIDTIINKVIENSPCKQSEYSPWQATFDLANDLRTAMGKTTDVNKILAAVKKQGWTIDRNDVTDLLNVRTDVLNTPVPIFEAKLYRPVEFNEFVAVVPDNISQADLDRIKSAGFIDVKTYEAGNDLARKELVNQVSREIFNMNKKLGLDMGLSENQKEFFKDSKLRDKNGDLIHCYHYTVHNFDAFDETTIGSQSGDDGYFGQGFYFTGRPNFNSCCWPDKEKGEELVKLDCYLNIKNPFCFDKLGERDLSLDNPYVYDKDTFLSYLKDNHKGDSFDIVANDDDFVAYLKEEYKYDDSYKELIEKYEAGENTFYDEVNGVSLDSLYYDMSRTGEIITPENLEFSHIHRGSLANYSAEITEYAKSMGFDGIISDGKSGEFYQPTEIVAFYPNQIKTSDNLNPTNSIYMRDNVSDIKQSSVIEQSKLDKDIEDYKKYYGYSDDLNEADKASVMKSVINKILSEELGDDKQLNLLSDRGFDSVAIKNAPVGMFNTSKTVINRELMVLPKHIGEIKITDNDTGLYHFTDKKFDAFDEAMIGIGHGTCYGSGVYLTDTEIVGYGKQMNIDYQPQKTFEFDINDINQVKEFLQTATDPNHVVNEHNIVINQPVKHDEPKVEQKISEPKQDIQPQSENKHIKHKIDIDMWD